MNVGANDHEEPKRKRGGKPSGVAESYDAAFRGYINLNLSDEQKANFESWIESASYWEALEFHVADGVNIAVKIDPKSGGYLASATQRRGGSPNAGLVVTARARAAVTALGRVVYCLVILSHSERWEDQQPMADPDRW